MIVQTCHRYICEIANNINCTVSTNPKKICKNCYNSKILEIPNSKIYICPLLYELSYKNNPLIDEVKVEVKPYCVCTKWKSKKRKK